MPHEDLRGLMLSNNPKVLAVTTFAILEVRRNQTFLKRLHSPTSMGLNYSQVLLGPVVAAGL